MPRLEWKDLVLETPFLKAILENQSEMVMWFDNNGLLRYANDRMLPYLSSVDNPYIDRQYLNCFHSRDRKVLENIMKEEDKSFQKAIFRMCKESENEFQELEFRIIFIDGSDDYQKSIMMIGKEITLLMESVAELAMNESVFKDLFQFLPDFVFLIRNNHIVNSNNSSKRLLNSNILHGECPFDSIFENPECVRDSLERKEVTKSNISLKGADNEPYLCDAIITYLGSDTAIMVLHDRMEVASFKNRYEMESIRYRNLFENMQTGMAEQRIVFNEHGEIKDLEYVDVNPAFDIQTGLSKDVIGKGIRDVMPNFEDFWYDMFVRVAQTGNTEFAENYVSDMGRWYSVFVFTTGHNRVGQIFLDISNQKNLETILLKSLQERDLLVKELHHRVQNNLQMIKGIVAMQYMRTDDSIVQLYLRETESRIQAMGQAHLSLFLSECLSSINIEAHLHNLLKEVAESFSKEVDADINVEGEELVLGLDQSVAISILINELLTNSFKFAFKNQKGKIYISIQNSSDSFRLVYQDFGEGYPTIPPVVNTDSLGLSLVESLVHRQLKGQITYSNQKGARVEITIPREV